jgi:hypothetical protein
MCIGSKEANMGIRDVYVRCDKCGRMTVLGEDATILDEDENTSICDICSGVKRDRYGGAWHPGELYQRRIGPGILGGILAIFGIGIILTREEAFRE